MNHDTMARMSGQGGVVAALDQSGGSTPGALRLYGIPDSKYSSDAEMFGLMHDMRVRIMTAPAFTGSKVLAAILFEGTMDGEVEGKPVPSFLAKERGIVPFVKVDKGLEAERDGVALMKPIIEPEVSVKSPDKADAEALLLQELVKGVDALPDETRVMLKLTLPEVPSLYAPLATHERVVQVVALSGGYARAEACQRLAANHGMIASFSRALLDDLRVGMSNSEFDAALDGAITEAYQASTVKV